MKLRILNPKQQEPFAVRIVTGARKVAPEMTRRAISVLIWKAAEPDEFANLKRFQANIALELDAKKVEQIKDDEGNVVDFRNVRIKGYLSTFGNTDRQGDVVEPGAFKDTIKPFMENPVLLTDHRNSVDNIAGHFTSMKEDRSGLLFEATISDAPDMASVRFKVAEGSLRAVSMGGLFHFLENGRSIARVDLWEGSLVGIPANASALFDVRALDDTDRKYIRNAHKFASYHHFLEAEGLLGETMRK